MWFKSYVMTDLSIMISRCCDEGPRTILHSLDSEWMSRMVDKYVKGSWNVLRVAFQAWHLFRRHSAGLTMQ